MADGNGSAECDHTGAGGPWLCLEEYPEKRKCSGASYHVCLVLDRTDIHLLSQWSVSSRFYGACGCESGKQLHSYIANVRKIAENTCFVGQSSILLNDPYVLSFMNDSHYLVPSVLFYGGWLPTILLMLIEVIFIVAMAGVCRQAKEHDGRDTMLDMIWVGFLIRVIAGLLYSFGLSIPILLPFSGTTGIITDSICMGMLLMGYLNRKLNLWCDLYEFCGLYEDDDKEWEDDEYEEDNK